MSETENDMAVRYLTELGWHPTIAANTVPLIRRMRREGHSHADIAETVTNNAREISPGLVRMICGD